MSNVSMVTNRRFVNVASRGGGWFAGMAVVFTLSAGGCGEPGSVSMPVPTTPTPPPATVTRTLSGLVYDTVSRPIVGATVDVVDGPAAGMMATSDERGYVLLTGSFLVGPITLRVSKAGYDTATKTVTVPSDVALGFTFSFTLRSLATPIDLTGNYTLTFKADDHCSDDLPAEVRTRTYTAAITPLRADAFSVTLTGSAEMVSRFPLQLLVSGDYAYMPIDPEFGIDVGLTERLAPDTYFQLIGVASGTAPISGTWSIPFNGAFDYCEVNLSAQQSPYLCSASNPTHRTCASRQHELVFSRR